MTALKNVLLVNAISSGATGALLMLFPAPIARLFGVEATAPFVAVGLFLLVFAAAVGYEALQKTPRTHRVQGIIILDVSWVVGSLVAVGLLFSTLSLLGNVAILAVAGWVAGMAFLQTKALRGLTA
ncbi:MAG: hypothetical protein ICV83_27230 [Cytophagales bacterium]|nr:hypothetical protein [Cytophagales bacterium]